MPGPFIKESFIDVDSAVAYIEDHSISIMDTSDLDPLFERIGDSQLVLLGEASHGTHEYYTWRSYITQKLIKEKGFNFIAVEGDWPDCYLLNRYVKNYAYPGRSAVEVLKQFNRWPTWMWANWEMVGLAEWLNEYNRHLPVEKKTGFYGLDVYSLWESMDAIFNYLKLIDPYVAETAEKAVRCFEPYRNDEGRAYARAAQLVPELCKDEVVELLRKIQDRLPNFDSDPENVLNLEQNAYVAFNAERYYRSMLKGGPHAWNLRDRHMADTLDRLLTFHGSGAKAIVWQHNSHIGDARATSMAAEGMFNLGELARLSHHEKGVVLVGFGSYKGEVTAASAWGGKMKTVAVPPARKNSWEYLLHKAGPENKLLLMDEFFDYQFMENYIDHRAIGVVYHSEYEQFGNYVPTLLPLRYDAFIYLDHTNALHPLHFEPDGHQVPETFPFGV